MTGNPSESKIFCQHYFRLSAYQLNASPAQTSFQAYQTSTLMAVPKSGQLVMGDSKHCDNTPMSPVSMCPCLAITDDLWWTLNMSSPGSRLATAWVTLYSYESQKSGGKYQDQTKTVQWKNVLIWDMTQYKTHLCWILIRPNIDNVDMFLWLRQIFKMNRRRLITKMYDW